MTMRAVAAAFILASLSLPAEAGLRVCNKATEKVHVAVAYVNPAGGFISEGWFTFQPCEACSQVVSSDKTSDPTTYFVYAKSQQGGDWSGDSIFCVRSGAFTYKNAQACSGDKVGFRRVSAPSGNARYTLTSSTSSCGNIDSE